MQVRKHYCQHPPKIHSITCWLQSRRTSETNISKYWGQNSALHPGGWWPDTESPKSLLTSTRAKNTSLSSRGATKIMENFRDLGGQPWKKGVKARPGEGQTLQRLHGFIKEMTKAWLAECPFTLRERKYWIITDLQRWTLQKYQCHKSNLLEQNQQ